MLNKTRKKRKTGEKRTDTNLVKNPINIDTSLPFKLVRLANLFGKNFYLTQSKVDYGLSLTEWRIMMALANHPNISAIDVCYYTGYTEVNISRAMKRMQKAGLISRTRDQNDRRRSILELTSSGADLYNKIKPIATASISDLTTSLSSSQEQQLHRYIDLLVHTMHTKTSNK
jgi:DNA-binding MarR family transcriptional regulator